MLLSFELTMPNVGSWNGKWSGGDKKYFIVKDISKRYIHKQEHFKTLIEKNQDSFYYNFGDGWGANISVEIVDAAEARKRRKLSKGFAGYEWMIDSIVWYGEIKSRSQKTKPQYKNT